MSQIPECPSWNESLRRSCSDPLSQKLVETGVQRREGLPSDSTAKSDCLGVRLQCAALSRAGRGSCPQTAGAPVMPQEVGGRAAHGRGAGGGPERRALGCLRSEGVPCARGSLPPCPARLPSRRISFPARLGARGPAPDEPGLCGRTDEAPAGPQEERAGHRAGLSLDLFALCFSGRLFRVGWGCWWLSWRLTACFMSSGGFAWLCFSISVFE